MLSSDQNMFHLTCWFNCWFFGFVLFPPVFSALTYFDWFVRHLRHHSVANHELWQKAYTPTSALVYWHQQEGKFCAEDLEMNDETKHSLPIPPHVTASSTTGKFGSVLFSPATFSAFTVSSLYSVTSRICPSWIMFPLCYTWRTSRDLRAKANLFNDVHGYALLALFHFISG